MSSGRPSRDGGLALGRLARENAAVIPVGDQDTSGRTGISNDTIAIIPINVLVFFYQLTSPDFTNGYSTGPAEITHGVDIVGPQTLQLSDCTTVQIDEAPGPNPLWLTLLTSMFMHGGWLHIGGDMLFLFIFGDNIERAFGSIKKLLFYLLCGGIPGLPPVASPPDSGIPSLRASAADSRAV